MGSWRNVTLVVAVMNHNFFQFVKISNKLAGVKGRDFEILQVLSSKMSFQYTLVTPVDGQWGNCDNQQCSGIIGMVARHEADMAISHISPTTSRAKYVDFTCPYFQEEITFVTKSIDAYQEVDKVFFAEPMDRQVWILLGSWLVIFLSVVKIMEYFELMKSKIMSAQTMLEIILRQSINLDRKKDKLSVVMTLLVFLITAGCICKLYECMLTSAASLIPVTPPIDTISDMINAIKTRGYVISAVQGTSHYQELLESNVEYMKIFANSTTGKDFVAPKTFKKSLEMMLNQNFAFITARNAITELLHLFNLPLETLHCGKENIFTDNIVISLGKQFSCRDEIDKWLNVLVSVGLIGKWQHEDMKVFNPPRNTIKSENVNYIGLTDLKYVFEILICGCLIGFVSLLIERLSFNYQSWRQHRVIKPNCAFN